MHKGEKTKGPRRKKEEIKMRNVVVVGHINPGGHNSIRFDRQVHRSARPLRREYRQLYRLRL